MTTALYRPHDTAAGARVELLQRRAQYGRGVWWQVRAFGATAPHWVPEWHLHEVTGVCAWCWPQAAVRWIGYGTGKLSHGICGMHSSQFHDGHW